jgi:hypothetical protein
LGQTILDLGSGLCEIQQQDKSHSSHLSAFVLNLNSLANPQTIALDLACFGFGFPQCTIGEDQINESRLETFLQQMKPWLIIIEIRHLKFFQTDAIRKYRVHLVIIDQLHEQPLQTKSEGPTCYTVSQIRETGQKHPHSVRPILNASHGVFNQYTLENTFVSFSGIINSFLRNDRPVENEMAFVEYIPHNMVRSSI